MRARRAATPRSIAELFDQKIDHHANFRRQIAATRISRVQRHRLDMVPVAQDRDQLATLDGIADDHIGQARNADPGHRQLENGFRIVGNDIAADMDDTDALVGGERPAPQDRQAGDPQAVVLLQVIRRARRSVSRQVGRRGASATFNA